MMTLDRYLSVTEAAASRHISSDTVKRLIKAGKLPAEKVGGQWRIREEDWLEYLRKGETKRNE